MTLGIIIISIMLLTGCNNFLNIQTNLKKKYFFNKKIIESTVHNWDSLIKSASIQYNIEEKLIKSIIYVESSGNPYARSSSNAIGLMQIKPSSAGMEVYRLNGEKGQPSVKELYNPKTNIKIGTAYLNLLQKKLIGIKNKDVLRCATILSYVNGNNALLKIFSKNRKQAISIINTMTIKSFCAHIKKNIHLLKLFVI